MVEEFGELARRAVSVYRAGDAVGAMSLCREAITGLALQGAYADLLVVLGNLATMVSDPNEKRRVLAQAVWLAVALETNDSILYMVALVQASQEGSPMVETLAAAALMEANRGGKPDLARAEMAMKLVSLVARQRRVVRAEADGFLRKFITDAPKVAATLLPALDEAVGEGWAFDRGPVIKMVGERLVARKSQTH